MAIETIFTDGISEEMRLKLQKLVDTGWLAQFALNEKTVPGGRSLGPLVSATFSSYPAGFNFRRHHAKPGTCYKAEVVVGKTPKTIMLSNDASDCWTAALLTTPKRRIVC